MSQSVVVNSVTYTIPDVGEEDWGQNVTDYLVALSVIASASQAFMTTVNVTSSPVTMISGRTYLVDTSSARTLTLPAAASNQFVIIKDKTGGAASFNITVARAGSESIDGVASNKTLARPYGSWLLACDGTNWFTINQFPDTGLINADVASAAAIAHSKMAALTVSRALVSDGSGIVAVSAVTSTELGYVAGVTSAIQTQMDLKAPKASPIFTGTVTAPIHVTGAANPAATGVIRLANTEYIAWRDGANAADMILGAGATQFTMDHALVINPTSNQLILGSGGSTNAVTITAPTPATTSRVWTIPDLATNATFAALQGTQTFSGNKTFSGSVTTVLTASRAMVTGASSELAVSATTAAELAFVSGVTSAIQTQINAITGATNPTVQKFTSGSGTYTTPAGVKWIRVRMVGAGGGGGGSGTGSPGSGATGGNTTFGSSLLVANGGAGGSPTGGNPGGAGGTASLGAAIGTALQGASGGGNWVDGAVTLEFGVGGMGGSSAFGGAGGSGPANAVGGAAISNTGGGGGGAGTNALANANTGSGGGAGGFVDAIIGSPSATYSYAVGAAGTAGTAGTGGFAGGAGGSGYIIVEEFYLA